jgi:hypothetical protein
MPNEISTLVEHILHTSMLGSILHVFVPFS